MDIDELKASLGREAPPPGLSRLVEALWYEARGDWDRAHTLVQDEEHGPGAWVHAYLHRKEGDASNAAYWYRRAGKPFSSLSLGAEWDEIAGELL